jgi:hypothetical protein
MSRLVDKAVYLKSVTELINLYKADGAANSVYQVDERLVGACIQRITYWRWQGI